MAVLGVAQLLLLASISFVLIASVAVSVSAPVVVRHTSSWAPSARCRALALLGLAPPLLTLAALISVLLPSLFAFIQPELDHCHGHDGHAHLCLMHPPQEVGASWVWTLIALTVAALFAPLAMISVRALKAQRLQGALFRSSSFAVEHGASVVPAAQPFCISLGLLRPRIMISDGLLRAASAGELEVMLAHEAAHVRRRDTLLRLLVRAGSAALWPSSRRMLLEALELSAEQACDEAAAVHTGDRLRVASTILAMERRLQDASGSPLAAAFGSGSVVDRVEAMLSPPRSGGAGSLLSALALTILGAVLAASPGLHHATESTLALLVH